MTNILEAIVNIANNPVVAIRNHYTGRNRANNVGEALEMFVKDAFANDHIISWSNEGDLVYDPFAGSGTTGKMAILNKRKCIMSEISAEYCEIIKKRLEPIINERMLF